MAPKFNLHYLLSPQRFPAALTEVQPPVVHSVCCLRMFSISTGEKLSFAIIEFNDHTAQKVYSGKGTMLVRH